MDIKTLTEEEHHKIDKYLTFIPETNKRFDIQNMYGGGQEPPVKCYYVKDKQLYLPYRFACMYYKRFSTWVPTHQCLPKMRPLWESY